MKRIIISILYVLPIISFGQVSATLKTTNASAGFQKLTVPTVGLIMNGSNGYNADTANFLVSKQRGDSLARAITANSTIYNVIKFGAVGDGVTDCTPFINAAIDSAFVHGGGIVDIPEGTFLVKAAYVTTDSYKPIGIILLSNVVLQGHGAATIIKLSAPEVASTFSGSYPSFTTNSVFSDIIRGYRVNNTIVRDLTIDGNLANQINTTLNPYTNPQWATSSTTGLAIVDSIYSTSSIAFYGGSNNKIINVSATSSSEYGFVFADCPYGLVSNSITQNAVNGGIGYFGKSNFGLAKNNVVTKSYSDGFRIQSPDITVDGNTVSWTRQNSNTSQANFAGIYLESADRCKIVNNTSSDNSSFGIDMNKNGNTSYGVLVMGNTLMQNRSAGMLMAINHSLITNNYIYDNGADSLGVKDTLPAGLYSHGGILVTASDSFATISNNIFLPGRGFQTYAFDNQGIYTNYTGNVIYNHTGFFINGNDWTKNTASNNISFNGTTTSYSNAGGITGSPGDIISFTTANVPSAIPAVASGYYLASQGSGTKPAWLITPITAQTTLVAGTKAISISGITTSSKATVSFVSIGGTVSTTWQYAVVCTANTVTITALTNAGATDTSDTSTLNYSVVY